MKSGIFQLDSCIVKILTMENLRKRRIVMISVAWVKMVGRQWIIFVFAAI